MAYVSLCKALYDYTAAAEDELTFTEDALLYVLDAEDAEWWKVKLKTAGGGEGDDGEDSGPIGLIPANYVEEAEPLRASRALYDYAKQNDDELELEEDEMLSVYEVKGDWLLVKKQQDGAPVGSLGFVPANYVDEVAAVDGVTEPMAVSTEDDIEPEPIARAIQPAASLPPARKVAKDDEIKMWAVSELDAKKKKKKGTLGIGNSALFFASESDKAPVQKLSVLSIVGHTIEGKGKQLNLQLDEDAASTVATDENSNIRFVMSNKNDVEEVWNKIEESQRKANAANEEQPAHQATAAPRLPPVARSVPPPSAATPAASTSAILPPPTRAAAPTAKPSAAAAPAAAPSKSAFGSGEKAVALYDFDAQGDDELSVAENEALILVDRETEDWWKVRNEHGQEGVVPASYVDVTESAVSAAHGVSAATAGAASMSMTDEGDEAEAHAAADAAQRAREAEEEEARRQEEEEEAAERARLQEERRAKAEAQRRAREAEDRRRQAIKAQPAPQPPRAPATTATTSTTASSRDVSIPSNKAAPARPKQAGKSKPNPAQTRIWHDRTGQFRVEAEFLGFNQGKIRLHKLNGVNIEVAVEKMSPADIAYLEEITGRKLTPAAARSSRSTASGAAPSNGGGDREKERERRREQEREQRRRQEAARGPKRNVDWFEFFLASGVDIDDCTRYASAFERDKIDEAILPELEPSTLRSIGLREGDIIRVTKFIAKRYSKSGGAAGSANGSATKGAMSPVDQIKSDEALARKLQEQEQAARRNGTTPPPNLFAGADGSLKNNTRRGRPNNAARQTSGVVDPASLAAASQSLARANSPPVRSNTTSPEIVRAQNTATTATSGFDDDAWTPRPPSAKPTTPAPTAAKSPPPVPTPPPQPPRPASTSISVAKSPSPAPVVAPPTPQPKAADPNSALFDKLAAMKPSTPMAAGSRPGASPLGMGVNSYGPRGPFAPVAQNQSMLQPLVPTQTSGQFMPTSLGYQPTGMGMQPQATGMGMGMGMGMQQQQPQATGWMPPQQTGYMQPQQTAYNGYGGGGSPFGNGMAMQPTGFAGIMSPPMPGQQPQPPQLTQAQYQQQQQQQKAQEVANGPDRFSAANVFGQMKQGALHSQPQQDANAAPQAPQRYDALRAQPTGFQAGGYLNYGGGGGGGYGYQ